MHETFALLVVDVPRNEIIGVTFTTNFNKQYTMVTNQEQHSNWGVFNVELSTHSEHMKSTRAITVIVRSFESILKDIRESDKHYGIPTIRFTFCVFLQENLFLSFNETNKKVSSAILGIGTKFNYTQTTSPREPIIVKFIISEVK